MPAHNPLDYLEDHRWTLPEVLPLFQAYRDKHSLWGNLYVVLEQDNLEDGGIAFARDQCIKSDDPDGIALCNIMSRLSMTQRNKIRDRIHASA